jgi:hypothetical protein
MLAERPARSQTSTRAPWGLACAHLFNPHELIDAVRGLDGGDEDELEHGGRLAGNVSRLRSARERARARATA